MWLTFGGLTTTRMKTILTLCCVLSFQLLWAQTSPSAVAVSPSAAATSSKVASSADEKAVIETEKQRFAAQVSKNYAVLDQVLASDLVYTHSHGGTDSKRGYIQSIRDGKSKYDAIDALEQNVRIYGNTAVVNGICMVKATSNGEPINSRLRYTSVYVKTGGKWQMVAWQSLKVAQ